MRLLDRFTGYKQHYSFSATAPKNIVLVCWYNIYIFDKENFNSVPPFLSLFD